MQVYICCLCHKHAISTSSHSPHFTQCYCRKVQFARMVFCIFVFSITLPSRCVCIYVNVISLSVCHFLALDSWCMRKTSIKRVLYVHSNSALDSVNSSLLFEFAGETNNNNTDKSSISSIDVGGNDSGLRALFNKHLLPNRTNLFKYEFLFSIKNHSHPLMMLLRVHCQPFGDDAIEKFKSFTAMD